MRTLSFPPDPPAELKDALADFGTLQRIWFNYKSPCSKENCPICQSKSDKKRGQEDDKDDKDDKENGEDEDENEDEEDEEEEDDSNEEDSEEDEEGNKDISSSRKSRKRKSKKQQDSTSTGLQDVNVAKKSTRASKHRKFLMGTRERDWMTSAPYDESVPYSHRYGYTWAGTTSNELMQMWQTYRKVEVD